MANHKSAEKRYRQSLIRRDRNRSAKSSCRTLVKKTKAAISAGELEKAQELRKATEKSIATAASKGIYHKKTAARLISRLASALNKSHTSASA